MSEEEKKKKGGVSRREFLRDAGFAVGGVAVSSTLLGVACAPKEVIKEVPVPGKEVIKEVPVPGKEVIKEVPGPTKTVEVTKGVPRPLTKLIVNGRTYELNIEPNWTLAYFLREKLGLTGTKIACDEGVCGSCTVGIDGKPYRSCLTLAIECDGRSIETIEGLASDPKKQPLLDMFWKKDAVQCGFCTPGMVVASKLLLDKIPKPTEAQIREELAGNICQCGIHKRVIEAILALSGGG